MEDRNSYDLVQNVSDWKQQLIQSATLTKDNINELESHLWDEVDNLINKDLSEEEAFLIAKKRIGKTELLQEEFGKVNTVRSIFSLLTPYIKGVLFYLSFVGLSRILLYSIFAFARHKGLSINSGSISIGIICFSVVFAVLVFSSPKGRNILNAMNKIHSLLIIILLCFVSEYLIGSRMYAFDTQALSYFTFNLTLLHEVPLQLVLLTSILLLVKNIRLKKLVIQN